MPSLFYIARQMTHRPLVEQASATDPGLRSIANRQVTRCQTLNDDPSADDGFHEAACSDVDGLLERLELALVRNAFLGQLVGNRIPAVLGVLIDAWNRRTILRRAAADGAEETLTLTQWRDLRNVQERSAQHGGSVATVRTSLLDVAALALAQVEALDRFQAAEYSVDAAAAAALREARATGEVTCRCVCAPPSLNVRTQESLRSAATLAIAAKPDVLLLEFSETETMDGSGIGSLVAIRKRCEEAGVRLRLEGVRPTIRTLLEMTRLDALLGYALEGRDD